MKNNVSTIKAVTISTLIAVSSLVSGCISYSINKWVDYGSSRAELNDSFILGIMEELYKKTKNVQSDTLDGAKTLTWRNGNGLHVLMYDQEPHKKLSVGDFACVTVDSEEVLFNTPISICDYVREDSLPPSFLRINYKHIGDNPKDLDPEELHKQRQYIKKILPKYFPNLGF